MKATEIGGVVDITRFSAHISELLHKVHWWSG